MMHPLVRQSRGLALYLRQCGGGALYRRPGTQRRGGGGRLTLRGGPALRRMSACTRTRSGRLTLGAAGVRALGAADAVAASTDAKIAVSRSLIVVVLLFYRPDYATYGDRWPRRLRSREGNSKVAEPIDRVVSRRSLGGKRRTQALMRNGAAKFRFVAAPIGSNSVLRERWTTDTKFSGVRLAVVSRIGAVNGNSRRCGCRQSADAASSSAQ